ncbi:MAG: endonuclease MutS2 [Treponema sp.]|nr:endonuclease MutS2 [Treponema sp.]
MDSKTLEILDYYRVRNQVAQFCASGEGREEILSREPFSSAEKFVLLKNLSREWKTCFASQKNISLKSWPEVKPLFSIIKTQGAFLPVDQFFAIGLFCMSARAIRQEIFNGKIELKLKHLPSLVESLPNLEEAENEIFKIIDKKSGALKDLQELREIKNAISEIRREIEGAFKKITSDANFAQILESNIPVVRAQREVIAVKSSERSKVRGIIHEVSNTGRTVFVEPEEVVRLNNELLQKEFEYERAVRQILIALSEKLSAFYGEFISALEIMVLLDATSAAAKWGEANGCHYAHELCEGQSVFLQTARHPLLMQTLGRDATIPIDMKFLGEKKVIIITGPNTGGKTAAIKTFALLSLLNQSGFPIPAGEETRLPFFDAIFADIGDEQSLDDSLSTFSAHIKNIAAAVENATEKSLVLLDELGSGTDGQEGAAIAMAVLDELLERKCFILVTTHQGALKNYGWTNPSCENASVEFDSVSMKPSYKIAMGIPGESHALEIVSAEAKRKPSFEKVVEGARKYIRTQEADVSTLIKGLSEKHSELDALLAEQKSKSEEIAAREMRSQETQMKLRRREHDLKVAQNKEESRFLRETRRRLENLVRELREGEITREKTLGVRNFINELEQMEKIHGKQLDSEEENLLRDEEKLQEKIDSQKNASQSYSQISKHKKKSHKKNAEALLSATPTLPERIPARKFHAQFVEGAKVKLKLGGMEGQLLHKEKGDLWSVQFGAIKMEVEQKKLRLVQDTHTPLGYAQESHSHDAPSIIYDFVEKKDNSPQLDFFPENKPFFELRILGMRRDEAMKVLEKQIDLCVIHGLPSFSVIHGKGTGALQQAVQDYLSHSPAVSEFQFADANDGGFGKTYVQLY